MIVKRIKNNQPEKILIISSFPPQRCGVASYADGQYQFLKSKNNVVFTMSPNLHGLANFAFSMNTLKGLWCGWVKVLSGRYTIVYVHFTDGLIWSKPASNIKAYFLLVKLLQPIMFGCMGYMLGKKGKLVAHEVVLRGNKGIIWFLLRRFGFMGWHEIQFHSDNNKNRFIEAFGAKSWRNLKVVDHSRYMKPHFKGDLKLARRELLIDREERKISLCLGFIKPHKGFLELVRDFPLDSNNVLYIVGSFVENGNFERRFLDKIGTKENIFFIEKYLTDYEFDRWLVASDVVILPYSEIDSSGVAARACLLNKAIIARNLPALVSQLSTYAMASFYKDCDELIFGLQKSHDGFKKIDLPAEKNKVGRVLFVVDLFGHPEAGGAERSILNLALELHKRGSDIEVWSTTTTAIFPRNRHYQVENDINFPMTVKRFPTALFGQMLFIKVHDILRKGFCKSSFLGLLWKRLNLFGYGMKKELIKRHHEFTSIHLCHYLGGSSHLLAGIYPQKTILHPFVHDEPFLHQPVIRDLFAGVRQVFCNTPAEISLAMAARCRYSRAHFRLIGIGIDFPVTKLITNKSRPYIIYVGRLEGKNIELLLRWHQLYLQQGGTLRLVIVGGKLNNNKSDNPYVSWRGQVSEDIKNELIGKAVALVQLSVFESFSLVLMEAWARRVPVIVHGDCQATSGHVRESKGGYIVNTDKQFNSALTQLRDDETRDHLAMMGYAYVDKNYSWDRVFARFEQALSEQESDDDVAIKNRLEWEFV